MSAITIIGSLDNRFKTYVAEKLIEQFTIEYPEVKTEVYLGYPIYIDEITNNKLSVDIALISKIGVYIINILEEPITDYGSLQDEIYSKVESKFKKNSFLFKKRKLIFDFTPITYCASINAEEDYLLAKNITELMDLINANAYSEELSEEIFHMITSGIQEAYGINAHNRREGLKCGSKAYAINSMADLIEKYDNSQMEAILSDTEGIQRIRGMAGSGKTVILARKAVELHTAHPDWEIVVTYSTRSLKSQLENLISKFYAIRNEGKKYNEQKLKIMHSWGSAKSRGVYYEICIKHGIAPLTLNEARARFGRTSNIFSKMCESVISEIHDFSKMYDCILIDEAQDFDRHFLQLCSKVLGVEQRLIYAYDELQALNEEQMPSPVSIFGHEINHDTPLTVCYRNQGAVIVTAHAMGMGLYRKEGLVQLPGSADVWNAIGYKMDKPLVEGEPVTLYRTKETSPDYLNISNEEIIQFSKLQDKQEMFDTLISIVNNDMEEDQLLPRDIMIIDMDTLAYSDNFSDLFLYMNAQHRQDKEAKYINIHTAGAANPEDFFRDDSIVYTSVRRAKGNESYMVYIINAQKCVNSLQRRKDRNALFTAITRSKGWVRVLGYGEDMEALCSEFSTIKENAFKLVFPKYPTKAEQELIFLNNKDVDNGDKKTLDQTKFLINKLTQEGNISKKQLMKQLFDSDTDELIKIIMESENEQGRN